MRLACRLALRLGIADPELWLETMPERVWSLWRAYFAAEPEQFGFTRTESEEKQSIEEQIHNAMSFAGARVPTNDNGGVIWPPR